MAELGSSSGGLAVRGASLLILLQVLSRAVTFIANQLLLRYLTAQLLGVSAQLEVYYLSVLFFARESLRVAIQRQGGSPTPSQTGGGGAAPQPSNEAQAVVNASYISILLGGFVTPLLGWLYLSSAGTSESISSTPWLSTSLYVYGLAAVTELLSEPAFVAMQVRLRFSVRARAEAVATLARCTVSLGLAVWAVRRGIELGVLPFALGQLSYGVALLAVYVWYGLGLAKDEGFSLLPAKLSGTMVSQKTKNTPTNAGGDYVVSYFYRPTLQLASSMMVQSLVKHVLTQGDTFLVSILSTPTAQGVYALANNYGGLIARLVFQPIEESSRNYFSRLLARPSETKDRTPAPEKKAVLQARTDLQLLLKVYSLLSLVITTLGPAAAPRLLSLVAGSHWISSGAGSCLSAYTWYIPLLAVNGVSEAFVASVATESQVHRQSAWMTAFSFAFACAGFVFMQVLDLGAIGLVWANGINMACRIVWCGIFISQYFDNLGTRFEIMGVLPGPWGVLASVVASQAIRIVVGPAAQESISSKRTFVCLVKIAGIAVPYLGVL
jgi:oligosaccharide translocation protein RFT1